MGEGVRDAILQPSERLDAVVTTGANSKPRGSLNFSVIVVVILSESGFLYQYIPFKSDDQIRLY